MITGSRKFSANGVIELVKSDVYRELDELHKINPDMTLLSGGARGVDQIGEKWAHERNVKCNIYKPNYKHYRKGAPLVRNKEMIDKCDSIVAFWNGTSKGTKHVLDNALSKLMICNTYKD